MNIREILQIELWSKETSRKILRPVGKFLKRAAVVFGVLVVLLVVAYEIESHWLTNGERTAGRVALAQVENLEKLVDSGSARFAVADASAKAAVATSNQKAWTLRDGSIADCLSLYLWEVEQMHGDDLSEAELKAFVQQRHLQWQASPKLDEQIRSTNLELFRNLRLGLHKELD